MANRKNRVERPRNAENWTESQYWSAVRSALRRAFRYWKPLQIVKNNARRKYTGSNKRQKWEYQCAKCHSWFKGDEVQVDHIIPCGPLKSYRELPGWLKRLTPEGLNAFQLLCISCHEVKTNEDREKGKI